MSRLHYFFDPLCGWCYGIAPLIAAAEHLPGVEMRLHGGGLWPQPTVLPPAMREKIRGYDAHLSRLTGQPHGKAYLEELLPSDHMVLDSAPTTAAVLAAGTLRPGGDLVMLRAIQRAHYIDGAHVVQRETLLRLAIAEGFDAVAFAAARDAAAPEAHIAESQALMRKLGVTGFPATFVEHRGSFTEVSPQDYFANPGGYVAAIQAALGEPLH